MPAGKDSGGGGGGDGGGGSNNAAGRTTFRPPWVREGPNPMPLPTAPWTLKNASRRGSNNTEEPPATIQTPKLRKTTPNSKVTVSQAQENGTSKETFFKPQLKPVPPKEPTKLQSKEVKVPVKLNSVKKDTPKAEDKRIQNLKSEDPEVIDKATPAARNALVRQESMRRVSQTPAPPPMPPPAPALPKLVESKPLSRKQENVLNQLRARPKVRPDWTAMLKEIESNKKLKHVECNDRSKPLLPKVKAKGQFLYESESPNVHNELLKQIQTGICLKKTQTNDRSKPLLEGLRKFRRQMTIEEQIIKSQSMASIPPEEIVTDEVDEMDDIDKVRDDLQSTKQMLALELRNKEAQIRENKRLQARIQNLEAELEKERNASKNKGDNISSVGSSSAADEKLIKLLKTEAEQARKASEDLEKKFHDTAEQLDTTKSALEETKKQNQLLEKKLQEALAGKRATLDKKENISKEDDVSDYEVEESESDDDLDEDAKKEKKAQKEVKVLRNKLRSYKNKQDNAKKERVALKQQMKTLQAAIKDEKKKFKTLQKEVNKMAALMKDTGDDDEDEDDEDKESEEEETESESESESSESETETDDSESEKSMSEEEDAPVDKKKANLTKRTTRHENILGALKKTNYMLKTNVERLQDDLNKQKELTQGLQEDLDSVLAELG